MDVRFGNIYLRRHLIKQLVPIIPSEGAYYRYIRLKALEPDILHGIYYKPDRTHLRSP